MLRIPQGREGKSAQTAIPLTRDMLACPDVNVGILRMISAPAGAYWLARFFPLKKLGQKDNPGDLCVLERLKGAGERTK
jgi:hypothetical protein